MIFMPMDKKDTSMKILNKFYLVFFAVFFLSLNLMADFIAISKGVKEVEITLNEETFIITRNQNTNNIITKLYNTTYRGIPQAMIIEKGIETIGELEFIQYMKEAQNNENILIIDSRTPGWYERLRIPGSLNIPFENFYNKEDALEVLEDDFNVLLNEDKSLDFKNAATLIIYCNGYWCGQTPAMIKNAKYSLLNLKYPKEKIKYYRGGMQAWTSMGFTVHGDEK